MIQVVMAIAAIGSPVITFIVADRNIQNSLKLAQKQVNSALRVAERQAHANVVSLNRQKWIDALREDISSFLTESYAMRVRLDIGPVSPQEVREMIKPMILVQNRIKLRLNPEEVDHRNLIDIIETILSDIVSADVPELERRCLSLSQAILKREWTRVKSGD